MYFYNTFFFKKKHKGICGIIKRGQEIKKMTIGDSFGELCLFFEAKRTCTVKAIANSFCLTLSKKKLEKILGGNVKDILNRNIIISCLKNNKNLGTLTNMQKELIASKIKINDYDKGEVLCKKGTNNESFLIVLEGHMSNVN